ncbi:MAG: helix-turn-helix domain-containing protein, partial [Candidatus Competibacteraceae bacterium]|nr:helix-turn-helix domain-containing protein [Candidatus Competibacteraceae bacterium]
RILLMPADAVRQVFATDAAFARALAVELALGYRAIVKELKNQKLRSSLERLASWIVQRDVEAGCTGRFELPFEKRVLASRLGMAPEVLSRTFGALAAYGVEIAGRIVTIGDRDALMKLARPTTTIDDPES